MYTRRGKEICIRIVERRRAILVLPRTLQLHPFLLHAYSHHNSPCPSAYLYPSFTTSLSRVSLTLYLAKDHVLPVEPRGLHRAHEELRPVGVGPRVGHREGTWARVLQLEVFVLELVAAKRSVAVVEVVVTGNQHK